MSVFILSWINRINRIFTMKFLIRIINLRFLLKNFSLQAFSYNLGRIDSYDVNAIVFKNLFMRLDPKPLNA